MKIRGKLLSLAAASALAGSAALAAPASASTLYTSIYTTANPTHCIDDPGDSTANGTQLQIWSCLQNENQNFVAVPESGGWELQLQNGKCVDGAGTANGGKLQVWACNGDLSQNWYPFPSADYPLSFGYGWVNGHGMFIDLTGGNNANGTKMQIWFQPSFDADLAETFCGPALASGARVISGYC